MNEIQKFLEKLRRFRNYTGMYISETNYSNVCVFIGGMDFCSEGEILKGFDEWLRTEFKLESPFSWAKLVEFIFEKNGMKDIEDNKINFLFDLVFSFLSERTSR